MRVHFVCTGNTCRSPFAEALFRKLAAERGLRVDVASGGLHAGERQPSPPVALAAARAHGVELAEHRARTLDRSAIAAGDLVIAMDQLHRRRLTEGRGLSGVEVRLLGTLDGSHEPEIEDPAGGPDVAYQRCYQRIAACVEALVSELAGSTAAEPRQ